MRARGGGELAASNLGFAAYFFPRSSHREKKRGKLGNTSRLGLPHSTRRRQRHHERQFVQNNAQVCEGELAHALCGHALGSHTVVFNTFLYLLTIPSSGVLVNSSGGAGDRGQAAREAEEARVRAPLQPPTEQPAAIGR